MMRVSVITSFFLVVLLSGTMHGQHYRYIVERIPSSVSDIDTSKLLSDRPLKSPWGAVLRSAVLPGWGQAYTDHYAKAAIAFSLNSLMIYQIYHYEKEWRREKNESFRSKRNLYSWYFALTYVLTMVDAYVDAWLYKFDTAMSISHRVKQKEDGQWYGELQLSFSF
ncbi:MAG: hypothetical protein EH225_01415 [Calditrichaeota bacterium]|nr:hypothetical protein [Calditrichota bacterium]RQV92713.1 MAG: hypothetical protein EH221_10985 [bacterium]RQW07638.1 MAG: hypothetical protein EH225_01415 [Calditrichota bacterium]